MEKPWYRRMFATGTPQPDLVSTRALAEGGDAAAQFFLGVHFSCREGAAQDFPQAARWYRLAADQNHSLAQFNLGVMLEQGQGIARDGVAAGQWIRRSADAGDAGAQFNCGNRCFRESVAARDQPAEGARWRVEACVWFQLAAAQGYRGSEAAREKINVMMSNSEVAEANDRVAGFRTRVVPAAN